MSDDDMLRRGDAHRTIVLTGEHVAGMKSSAVIDHICAAIRALPAVRSHVNETPKNEHDARDVLTLTSERDRLRAALIAERIDTLWNAYSTGMERDGRWRHMCMSDGEWLEHECGLDDSQRDHPADEVKAAIPLAAKRFVAALAAPEE